MKNDLFDNISCINKKSDYSIADINLISEDLKGNDNKLLSLYNNTQIKYTKKNSFLSNLFSNIGNFINGIKFSCCFCNCSCEYIKEEKETELNF